jgi:hypothetical protein
MVEARPGRSETCAKDTTMAELTGRPGFAPRTEKTQTRRRAVAIELVATMTLTVSLIVAATAVSIGNRSLKRDDMTARPLAHIQTGMLLEQVEGWLTGVIQP